jgi:hypothetical protein
MASGAAESSRNPSVKGMAMTETRIKSSALLPGSTQIAEAVMKPHENGDSPEGGSYFFMDSASSWFVKKSLLLRDTDDKGKEN